MNYSDRIKKFNQVSTIIDANKLFDKSAKKNTLKNKILLMAKNSELFTANSINTERYNLKSSCYFFIKY